MIRNKKNLLFLLIITIVFFTGINRVSARENTKCYYSLPFRGINPSNGKYLVINSNHPCYSSSGDTKYIDCSIEAKISSEDPGFEQNCWGGLVTQCDEYVKTGNEVYGYGNHYSDGGVVLFGITDKAKNCLNNCDSDEMHSEYDDPTGQDTHVYIKSSTDVCPGYIVLRIPSEGLSTAYANRLEEYAEDDAKAWYTSDHLYYGPRASKISDLLTMSYQISDRTQYKNSLKQIKNVSTTNVGKNGFKITSSFDANYLYKDVVLPLVNAEGNVNKEKNSKIIDEATGDFRDIVIGSWIDLIDKQLKSLKSSCGKDYGKYINLKNYKDSFTSGGSKSAKFVDYAIGSYSSDALVSPDKGISSSCWDARKDYMNAYKTFRVFMYSIGATTDGDVNFEEYGGSNVFAESIIKDNNVTHASNNIVKNWDSFVCFFRFVRYGEDDDNFSKCTSGNEAVEEKKTSSKNVVNSAYAQSLFNSDRCAYKCFGNLSIDNILSKTENWFEGQYNLCKNHSTGVGTAKTDGASYEDCLKAYSECGGSNYSDKQETCKKSAGNSTSNVAYLKCMESYTDSLISETFDSCMDEKIPNWSTKSKEAYNNAAEAYKKAVEDYTVSGTYNFESTGLLRFKYGLKKYTPKCKDITFLTSIWNVIIVLAPFLLIIYTAFDYFKVVMAGDEEKMKVTKKKIPRRVIALVILLVFPAILKMLVTKFGTHGSQNTKYIRCILSRDYGENEEDDEEETEKEDNKDKEN